MSSDLNRICPILLDSSLMLGLEQSDKILRNPITPRGIYNWHYILILLCSITYHILFLDFPLHNMDPFHVDFTVDLQVQIPHTHTLRQNTHMKLFGMIMMFSSNQTTLFMFHLELGL